MAIVGYGGKVTSYDLAVGVKINMDELIYMISPTDSPFINGIGTDGRQLLSSSPVDQQEFKWMDEELLIPRATVTDTGAAGAGATDVTVSAADSYKFQVDDLITIGEADAAVNAAVKRVTHVNNTAGVLTLADWANSADWPATTAAHADTVICVGTALVEGSDPGEARSADRTIRTNCTQIFGPTPIHMSRSEQQVTRYGVSDEFAKQVYGRSVENVITREQAYLYGQYNNDTSNKRRSTGGLNYHITSNTDTSTTLTVSALEALQQKCYNAGGMPDLLIANPASFATLNAVSDSGRVRTVIDDPRRGRVPVASVFTEFGETQMLRNRWCHAETAFLIAKEGISRRVMQPLVVEALAKTGDSDKVQIVCEEGLQVKGEQHMGKFTTLTGYSD
tara:strand:- start:1708 stop:2883 length:1176 start_codon:yes stop_codon:yes gene_type:complete